AGLQAEVVVGADDAAALDKNLFAAVKVEAVAVVVVVIFNVQPGRPDPPAVQAGHRPGGRVVKPEPLQADVLAAQEAQQHRAAAARVAGIGEGRGAAVDGPGPPQRDAGGVLRVQKTAVKFRLVAVAVVVGVGGVVGNIGAGEQHGPGGDLQRGAALQVQGAAA